MPYGTVTAPLLDSTTLHPGYGRPPLAMGSEPWFTFSRQRDSGMAYRRTEKVALRLAVRHDAIIAAARTIAGESGMAAVQIAPVAARAGIAAGTVYRYFPSKTEMVAALVAAVSAREIGAGRRA